MTRSVAPLAACLPDVGTQAFAAEARCQSPLVAQADRLGDVYPSKVRPAVIVQEDLFSETASGPPFDDPACKPGLADWRLINSQRSSGR